MSNKNTINRNYRNLLTNRNLFVIIFAICIYLRLINIISEQLWEDEAFSIVLASSPDNIFWRKAIGDIYPPLYYLLLRGWILMFGNSVFSTRLLSAIFSILTLPILYLIGKEIKDEKLALIIIFLYSISPFSIYYANEVRAYSLIHLLFTLSLYFGIKCLKSPNNFKNYLFLSLTGSLLIYTHYMGFIYYGIVLLGIIIFNKKEKSVFKKVFFSLIITIISYIPWMPYAVSDLLGGAHGYAGGALNLISLSYWAFNFFLGPVPSKINDPYVLKLIILTFLINIPLMILSVISLIGVIIIFQNRDDFDFKAIFFFIILLTVLLFGISIITGFIIVNSFTSKNIIGGLTLIHIVEAFGLYQLFYNKNISKSEIKIFKIISILLSKILAKKLIYSIIIILLVFNIIIYPIFRAFYLQKPDWDGCIKKLKQKFEKNDIIILCYPGGPYSDVMKYYSDLNDFDLKGNFDDLNYDKGEIEEFFEDILKENITRIWIITFWENYRDPKDKTDDMVVDKYNLEEIKEYNFRLDIRLTLYELPQ